jgi:hypothetical protein
MWLERNALYPKEKLPAERPPLGEVLVMEIGMGYWALKAYCKPIRLMKAQE